jgi:hypothetical protein
LGCGSSHCLRCLIRSHQKSRYARKSACFNRPTLRSARLLRVIANHEIAACILLHPRLNCPVQRLFRVHSWFIGRVFAGTSGAWVGLSRCISQSRRRGRVQAWVLGRPVGATSYRTAASNRVVNSSQSAGSSPDPLS